MNKKNERVIPGFGISLGVTITMVALIVLIPLASLVIYTAGMSFSDIIDVITNDRVVASFKVSLLTAFIASFINTVMGVMLGFSLDTSFLLKEF